MLINTQNKNAYMVNIGLAKHQDGSIAIVTKLTSF